MNLKQIACLAIMFIIIFRTFVVSPPEKCVTNLHDDSKSNMAVIVKTSEIVGDIAPPPSLSPRVSVDEFSRLSKLTIFLTRGASLVRFAR